MVYDKHRLLSVPNPGGSLPFLFSANTHMVAATHMVGETLEYGR